MMEWYMYIMQTWSIPHVAYMWTWMAEQEKQSSISDHDNYARSNHLQALAGVDPYSVTAINQQEDWPYQLLKSCQSISAN